MNGREMEMQLLELIESLDEKSNLGRLYTRALMALQAARHMTAGMDAHAREELGNEFVEAD